MTVGVVAATLNSMLDGQFGTVWVKLHTGDPSAAATANTSVVTTRQQATMSAASGGSKAMSGTISFSMTATETISHVSFWTASSGGSVLATAALTASRSVINGDTLQINTLSIALTPVAV
jgi:hypothetical protein